MGWVRVGSTVVAGVVAVALLAGQGVAVPLLAATGLLFAVLALWYWMHLASRFIVDDRGLTVSLGGFWPRPTWPLADFRTVQLRELGRDSVGATVGGYGWRTRAILPAAAEDLTPVAARRVHPLPASRATYRLMVTQPGTMVEIIGRRDVHYLISPRDPGSTAAAVDQAIRARR